jgi:OOP family OmpA-OmpF porin
MDKKLVGRACTPMLTLLATVVVWGGALPGIASAADLSAGHAYDSAKQVVRTGSGGCVRTNYWSTENAIMECDPEIVAARDKPAEQVAKVEPQAVIRKISLQADTTFGFDTATLTPQGQQKLDEIANSMHGNMKDVQIRVTGYTDRIGSEQYNQQLSEKRAAAVKEYLTSKGVPASAIEIAGRGASDPVVSCEGKRGNALIECLGPNRRSEIEFSAFEEVTPEQSQ